MVRIMIMAMANLTEMLRVMVLVRIIVRVIYYCNTIITINRVKMMVRIS